MTADLRRFLLIGPGRWGTNDHWLGIPVQWSDISNVQAIIEVQNEKLRADPSQGSHFFQNITSLGIPYMTIDERNNASENSRKGHVDWDWLLGLTPAHDGRWIRHIRLKHSLTIKCEGRDSTGIVMYREDLINKTCTREDENRE